MKELRNKLVSLGINTSKLDKITEQVEDEMLYKVYIFYEFFRWEDSTYKELYVLYTEDKALAGRYYDLLQEVKSVLISRCGKQHHFSVGVERLPIYKTVRERCPFCGAPVDRSKGYYCPNCGST